MRVGLIVFSSLLVIIFCDWRLVHGDPIYSDDPTAAVSKLYNSTSFDSHNHPGQRFWPGWLQMSLNRLYLFGGGGYHLLDETNFLCDLWEYDTDINMWKFIKGCLDYGGFYYETGKKDNLWSEFTYPGGRQCPTMFPNPFNNHRFFLFGGFYFNSELWEFDNSVNWWRMVRDTSSLGSNKYGNFSSENMIPARACHMQWLDENFVYSLYSPCFPSNNALVFGGIGDNGNYADTWVMDIELNEWQWLVGNGTSGERLYGSYESDDFSPTNVPPARYGAGTWRDRNFFYLHNGRSSAIDQFFRDLWIFDYNISEWKCLKNCQLPENYTVENSVFTANQTYDVFNIPSVRRSSFIWQMGYDNVYLYGGDFFDQDFLYSLGDFWQFDTRLQMFRCLMFCGDINSTVDRMYNETFPKVISARSAGAAFKNKNGYMMLFAGYFAMNDIWEYFDDTIETCRNVSLHEVLCNGHGSCVNDTCFCHENYTGVECEKWDCFGVSDDGNSSICNAHGDCEDVDTCNCIGFENDPFMSVTSESVCSEYTCFLQPFNTSKVCDGRGDCLGLNQCNCSENFYGEQCQEKINFARFANYGQTIEISYKIDRGYVREYHSFFNCSADIILNVHLLGIDARCSWEFSRSGKTSRFIIYLGDERDIHVGDVMYVVPQTSWANGNYTQVVALEVLPEIYVFNPEILLFIIFMCVIVICSLLIIVVLVVLIWLIYKNIQMCRDVQRQQGLLDYMGGKPHTP